MTSVTSTHEASASAFPFRRVGMHLDGQGAVPLAPKAQAASLSRTYCVSDTPSVFTARQQQGRTHEAVRPPVHKNRFSSFQQTC